MTAMIKLTHAEELSHGSVGPPYNVTAAMPRGEGRAYLPSRKPPWGPASHRVTARPVTFPRTLILIHCLLNRGHWFVNVSLLRTRNSCSFNLFRLFFRTNIDDAVLKDGMGSDMQNVVQRSPTTCSTINVLLVHLLERFHGKQKLFYSYDSCSMNRPGTQFIILS